MSFETINLAIARDKFYEVFYFLFLNFKQMLIRYAQSFYTHIILLVSRDRQNKCANRTVRLHTHRVFAIFPVQLMWAFDGHERSLPIERRIGLLTSESVAVADRVELILLLRRGHAVRASRRRSVRQQRRDRRRAAVSSRARRRRRRLVVASGGGRRIYVQRYGEVFFVLVGEERRVAGIAVQPLAGRRTHASVSGLHGTQLAE